MSIRRATSALLATTALFTSALAAPRLALADAPNDPCEGLQPGAACVTFDGEDGTCQELPNGFLDCVPGGGTTTAAASTSAATGSTTATTGGGTSSASGATTGAGSTTGAGTTTGAGGGSGSGGSDEGGSAEDDGCTVRAPSSKVAGRTGAAVVFVAALLGALRRWRRRSAG